MASRSTIFRHPSQGGGGAQTGGTLTGGTFGGSGINGSTDNTGGTNNMGIGGSGFGGPNNSAIPAGAANPTRRTGR